MSATSVEKMVAFREMIMGNVLRLGNSATNAEAKTILRELLLAREGTGGNIRQAFEETNHGAGMRLRNHRFLRPIAASLGGEEDSGVVENDSDIPI